MTRRFFDIGLLLLALLLAAVLSRQHSGAPQVRVDLVAKDITRGEAFERLVDSAGLRVVGSWSGTDESYTYDFDLHDVAVGDALEKVHLGRGWKLLGGVLVITPTWSDSPEWCRFEMLLEHAPVKVLLPELEAAFPDIVFTEHPAMNGFFPYGSKSSLLELRRTLVQLDLEGAPPFPKIVRGYQLQVISAEKVVQELNARFPAIQVKPDGRTLLMDGPLADVGEALSYLDDTDRLQEKAEISLNRLANSTHICHFYSANNVDLRVDCPPDCQGPLQAMGLQTGDWIYSQHVRQLAAQPEWRITRKGVPTRIILNLKP